MDYSEWAKERIDEYFDTLLGRPVKVEVQDPDSDCQIDFRSGSVSCKLYFPEIDEDRFYDFSLKELNDPSSAAERMRDKMLAEEGKITL